MTTPFASLSRTCALVGGLVVVAMIGLAAPAAAHNFVVSSTPEQDEIVTALPESWQLTTNEALLDLGGEGAGFAMLISDDAGLFYGDGCIAVQDSSMSTLAALGEPGAYAMVYQFISADGHTLSGELTFTWQPTEAIDPHVGLAEPPICGETASAPAPEQNDSDQPEQSLAVTAESDPQPIEPISDQTSPIVIAVAFAVVVAVVGVVTGAILRSRARRPGEPPHGPEDTHD